MSIITLSRVHLCSAGSHVAVFQISNFSLLQDLCPLKDFNAVPVQHICACAVVGHTPPAHNHNSTEQWNITVQRLLFSASQQVAAQQDPSLGISPENESERRRKGGAVLRICSPEKPRCEMSPDNMTGIIFLEWEKSALGEMPHMEERHLLSMCWIQNPCTVAWRLPCCWRVSKTEKQQEIKEPQNLRDIETEQKHKGKQQD